MGATDVVPFIPIEGVTIEDCVVLAKKVGREIWERYRIPVYFYEAAAQRSERTNLENIRKGQFEGLREEVLRNPDRAPDVGEPRLHPTAGATVVGARKFLVAYNINLNTPDIEIAKRIGLRRHHLSVIVSPPLPGSIRLPARVHPVQGAHRRHVTTAS